MNYSFISSGLLVLAVFLVYYFARPRIPIGINRTFFTLLTLELLTIAVDLIDDRANRAFQTLPPQLLYVLNTAFCILYITRVYCFFVFTTEAIGVKNTASTAQRWLCRTVFIASFAVVIANLGTSEMFRIDGTGYHPGDMYFIIYICSFFYIALAIGLIIARASRLERHKIAAAIGYNLVLFAGTVIRMFVPDFFVMNMFCLLAIIIIYLSFENPEFYTSDRGLAFNMKAFRELLSERIRGKPYRVLGFVLRNYVEERGIYGNSQMDHGIRLISEYLTHTYPETYVFYLRNGCFAIVGGGSMNWAVLRREIYERFSKPWSAFDADLYLNVAFVQVGWESKFTDADRLINNMIIAFDEADRLGDPQNTFINLDVLQDRSQQTDIKRHIERALEKNEVEIFLQPLVDSNTGKLVAAEALARIRDTDGGLISPALFIPIAEKNGRISKMGEQVLEHTCRFIRDHDMEALGLQWINVNLSPIQCMKRDLNERFNAILEKYNVDPKYVHLELTEQAIVDFSALEAQVAALHDSGFEFVLDDYGTGYSNLTRVRHYPFSNVKLDMEVVRDYFNDRDDMIPAIVRAFKQVGYKITAEGIETKEMMEALADIGCDILQGYYFSKPLPPGEFVKKYS